MLSPVAASALKAQQSRMRVIAENLANANSTSRTAGGDPYRRQVPVFTAQEVDGGQGVRMIKVEQDPSAFRSTYDPGHPGADAAGYVKLPNVDSLIVVLNDNDMSIAPPVGGMSAYMARLVSGGGYQSLRKLGKSVANILPKPMQTAARKAEEYARGMVTGGTFFEELGFYYIGPIDGHDLDNLVPILKNAAAITDRYCKDGYFLSRAVVPPQLRGGHMARIVIYEGYIDEVAVTGDGSASAGAALKSVTGSSRKPTLNSAAPIADRPPGAVADAVGPGCRYVPAATSHKPRPLESIHSVQAT